MAEMTALEFLKEKKRMCKSYGMFCAGCEIYRKKGECFCEEFIRDFPEEAIAIVEKWSKEHPQKTLLQDLLEKYPNAELRYNKFPEICPYSLGYETNENCFLDTDEQFFSEECEECWNRPLEEVQKNG